MPSVLTQSLTPSWTDGVVSKHYSRKAENRMNSAEGDPGLNSDGAFLTGGDGFTGPCLSLHPCKDIPSPMAARAKD